MKQAWNVDTPIDVVGAYSRVRRIVHGDRAGHVLQYPIISSGLKPNSQELLTLLAEDPYRKPPPFEKPVGDLAGAYSRRINIQHRLVYRCLKKSG